MATFIFKNLSRRKTRALLTVLGIAVGVAANLQPVEALRYE